MDPATASDEPWRRRRPHHGHRHRHAGRPHPRRDHGALFLKFSLAVLALVAAFWLLSELHLDRVNAKRQRQLQTRRQDRIALYKQPQCPACVRFEPMWNEFVAAQPADSTTVVDCSVTPELCAGVSSVPTIMTESSNRLFRQPRTLENLRAYAAQIANSQ